eukprot:26817_1
MNQYPSSKNNEPPNGALLINDNISDYSDYATSDIESSPSVSPRGNHMEPISMTAFDLIGIVSTQMLNNVFTRSLQEKSNQVKTYTRFVSNSSPPKILYAIQEAVHRMADCTCRVASDRYEIKVIKRKGHRMIHINIQIFQTPASEYMIECRRTQGNIFRYHDFFEEFKLKYEDVIHHLDKNPIVISPNNTKKPKQQIKFRDLDKNNGAKNMNNKNDDKDNGKHARSISDNAVIRNMQKLEKLPEDKHIKNNINMNNNDEVKEITENLPPMTELCASQSTPTNQPHHKHHYHQNNPSNISIKSSTSSAFSMPSHHSSVSSQKSYTSEPNNLTSSASPSPTPTHQNNAETANDNFPPSQQSQSYTSTTIEDDQSDSSHSHNDDNQSDSNTQLTQPKGAKGGHRRRSSSTYKISKTGHLDIPQKVSEV